MTQIRRSALALRGHCVLRRGQDVPSFPRALFLACGILPSLRYGQVFLDEAEHLLHNRDASVATLRNCSPSARNAVRVPFGISIRLRRNPQRRFSDARNHRMVPVKSSVSPGTAAPLYTAAAAAAVLCCSNSVGPHARSLRGTSRDFSHRVRGRALCSVD